MKIIIINTPKGQYSIPMMPIAVGRADHYEEQGSEEWKNEIKWVMEDDYEAIDWLMNNMDWKDVQDRATKLNDKVLVTDDDFWTSSEDFEISYNDEEYDEGN